ncbi:quaternary ammonium compound efflux SMR transporter SugE [Falsiroseomonas stagni]|uniref:Guanidinium exporter n=1 Tax=Falsiroseomonas stagni DSM 19981 TaxID=1123062 RepID=A0A1I3ZPN0_9PROT|nr:quaternary ammonium compound efflux SMR transporter SugE [Falsiroseomonas stagni]SFK46094.1 quaternary ammonium compound-resistance protein SugE [Falsiroseomonas stagni DSM 19981]
MAWVWLGLAGLLEVGWAVGLKFTEGFSRLVPTVLTLGAMALSIGLLGMALKTLPVGTAYAIWTGIGAVGTAIFGVLVLGEAATVARISGIALIAAGIITLKLGS